MKLFCVLDELNNRGGLKAAFSNNVKRVNRGGKDGWGDITIAIDSESAGNLIASMAGGEVTHTIALFVLDRKLMDQIQDEMKTRDEVKE